MREECSVLPDVSPNRSATEIEQASLPSCLGDGLMYLWNASLFQHPSCLMVESGNPSFAAAVAAPIQKLCPEKPDGSILATINASLRHDTKELRVSGVPDWK